MRAAVLGLWSLIKRAVLFELGIWRSLARWIGRRPKVPEDGTAFAYRSPVVAPLLIFINVSAIEVIVIDLVLPWESLRLPLLVLGIWGTVLMVGILAAVTVHPHVLRPRELWIRYGASVDFRLPLDAIATVRTSRQNHEGRTVQVDGDALRVLVLKQTTVALALNRPVLISPRPGQQVEVREVHLHVDDEKRFLIALRDVVAPGRAPR